MIETLDTFRLAQPYWLLAALALPLVAWLRGRRSVAAIILPFAGAWRRASLIGGSRLPAALAFAAALFMIVALARPQSVETERHSKSKGYDIMLAIDLSTSMYIEDYTDGRDRINRLQAVKPVISAFVRKRQNDRIGLVAFSGRAYTASPLTFDHAWLARQAERLKIGLIEDGTAIGDAIAVATSRLQEGAKERAGEREGAFIVLLTDGDNTAGLMDPLEGARLAADAGIRIYTIAAGREGRVRMPIFDEEGNRLGYRDVISQVDIASLRKISDTTKGEFFRAQESDTIEEAFRRIDEASKVEFEVSQYSVVTELFPYALAASGLLLAASLFAVTRNESEAPA